MRFPKSANDLRTANVAPMQRRNDAKHYARLTRGERNC